MKTSNQPERTDGRATAPRFVMSHLTYNYRRHGEPVINDVCFTLSSGHIYALLGENGVGKTTLLHLMSGLLRPQQGSALCEGERTDRRRTETLGSIYLLEEEPEVPQMAIGDYGRLTGAFYPHYSDAIFADCLAAFSLEPQQRLHHLSMGQRKKALIAFALATQVRWLLMDEPTNGLDIPGKEVFKQLMARHVSDDMAVVISTHLVDDIEMLTDHVLVMKGSRLIVDCPTDVITQRLRFEERHMGSAMADAIYSQPTPAGCLVVCRNTTGEETPLHLALFFNAVITQPHLMDDATQPDGDANGNDAAKS